MIIRYFDSVSVIAFVIGKGTIMFLKSVETSIKNDLKIASKRNEFENRIFDGLKWRAGRKTANWDGSQSNKLGPGALGRLYV